MAKETKSVVHDTAGLLDVEGAAKYLGVSMAFIYKNNHSLPAIRVGRKIRFFKNDLDKWLISRRAPIRPLTAGGAK